MVANQAENKRQDLVSALRGVAIVMVLFVHIADKMFPDGLAGRVCSFGQMGCQVFFVLSGYCLCCSMQNNRIGLARFYKKRLFSLAPGYWIAIVVSVILSILCPAFFSVMTRPAAVIQNLLLLNGLTLDWNVMNNVVFGGWFVGTLVLMYVVFPLLHWAYFGGGAFWERYRILAFPLLVIFCCWALLVISGIGSETFCENDSVKYFSIINQLPSFVIGFSLYDAVRKKRSGGLILSLLFFAVTVLLFYIPTGMSFIICPTSMAFAVAFLFVGIYQKGIRFPVFLCKAGDMSYSIYLSHIWVVCLGAFLIQKGLSIAAVLPLLVLAILLVAYIIDRLLRVVKLH